MVAFDAAANERMALRLGRDRDADAGAACPAVWGTPVPRQSGARGEAADREADAALLEVRRLRSLGVALRGVEGPAPVPHRAGKVVQALIRGAPAERRDAWARADWRRP
eukprot:2455372-Lingulodinium_polyedra.AAC.1